MTAKTPFGREMRKHFLFDCDYVPLNHGSFGTYPAEVRRKLIELMDDEEKFPDTFIRYKAPLYLDQSRAAVAALLNADPSTVVFVPNVTVAVNTVLRNLVWEEGDVILLYDTVYGGNEKTVSYIAESTPAESELLDFGWPIEDDDLVERFESAVNRINTDGDGKRRVRLAILDTITSQPGLRVPYEKLVEACRKHGVLSLVDGAQGIGQIPIDLSSLDADFFTTNLHKWLFVPRGCAILQVPSRNQGLIRSSLPTSHNFQPLPASNRRAVASPFPPTNLSRFQDLFNFVGTINSSNYYTVTTALKFRREVCGGEDAIMNYCISLAQDGGDRAAEVLGTEVLKNKTETLRNCAFANVRLPLEYGGDPGQVTQREKVSQFIMGESAAAGTFLAVTFYRGAHYWRISGQCYLDMADIEWGAGFMKRLCERVKNGEHVNAAPYSPQI